MRSGQWELRCRRVVETRPLPRRRVVAVRALSTVMIGRFILGMAGGAVGQTGVVKLGVLPAAGIVAL